MTPIIPNNVIICGIPHKVELVADYFDTDIHFGQIDYAKAEIRINKNATPELQMQSLFHEILHGILVLTGEAELAGDERFVQNLSNAMYGTFSIRDEGAGTDEE